jgi:hypothetical protein
MKREKIDTSKRRRSHVFACSAHTIGDGASQSDQTGRSTEMMFLSSCQSGTTDDSQLVDKQFSWERLEMGDGDMKGGAPSQEAPSRANQMAMRVNQKVHALSR